MRISWDEAYRTIADNIMQLREKYGPESLFTWCGTGRQWCMQSDAGMALELFGTPNIIAAYQVCKVRAIFRRVSTTFRRGLGVR